MNKLFIATTALALGVSFASCDDDDWSASGPNREFQTQFRQSKTTNMGEGNDPYECQASGRNDIRLYWYLVNDVYGYEIRYGIGQNLNSNWVTEDYIDKIIIRGAENYTYLLEDIQYNTKYRFAIRTLSNKGLSANPSDEELIANPHNSNWYGIGDGSHQDNICMVISNQRYFTPKVLSREFVTQTSLDAVLDMRVKATDKSNPELDASKQDESSVEIFGTRLIENAEGNKFYKADYITLNATEQGNKEVARIELSNYPELLTTGRARVKVEGLQKNTMYSINVWNNDETLRNGDKPYNTVMVRTHGDPIDPILIPAGYNAADSAYLVEPEDNWTEETLAQRKYQAAALSKRAQELNAKQIDDILQSFMVDPEKPEGTIFKLEPGGVYYCNSTVTMSKGFTLVCDDPNNRATVYMGIGCNVDKDNKETGPRSNNWSFGRNPKPGEDGGIQVEGIKFENINFLCDKSVSFEKLGAFEHYGWNSSSTGTGNYFINQFSEAMPFVLESFEVNNCTFKNFIRGWIRVQGIQTKVFRKFHVNGCTFSSCGMYKVNGQGYAFISCNEGTMSDDTNLFEDFVFTNNLVIDYPGALFATQKWTTFNGYWNIKFNNNVIVNPSTYKQTAMFDIRNSVPSEGMTMQVKDNLFVITRVNDADERPLFTSGVDIRKFENVTFDISNNWSTAHYSPTSGDPLADDSYFTSSSNRFSSTNRGAGSTDAELVNMPNGVEDANVKVLTRDGKELYAADVFEDPRPLGKYTDETPWDNAMHDFKVEGFKLKDNSIVPAGVGAPCIRQ
ncbi:MAG: hypothetical protein II951_13180 [Bacteroidales bacterium]|nr:hypothetical protein [Bacteroidales bacterium]